MPYGTVGQTRKEGRMSMIQYSRTRTFPSLEWYKWQFSHMIEEDVRTTSAAGGRYGAGAIAESLDTNLQTGGRGEY